jgi:hypothetical protein
MDEADKELAILKASIVINAQTKPANCYPVINTVNRYLAKIYDI